MSHEVAEPHESQGTSPCPCPLADTAVGSASRLAAALTACRDLPVTSSVRALLSISPFPRFFSSLIHPADPLCPYLHLLFSSSSLLSSSSSVLSFSILFSHCAFHLVFLSCFFLLLSCSPPSCTPFLGLLSPFCPPLFPPFGTLCCCMASFLNPFTLRCHSLLPMLQGNINYVSLK